MDIDKAISELADCAYMGSVTLGQTFRDACKLGIEALKVVKRQRIGAPLDGSDTLPGETPNWPKSLTDPSIKLGQPGKEK